MTPEHASRFNAVDNLTLPSLLGPILLTAGRYPNGEGAIEVQSEQGEPLFTLTHNLADKMAQAAEQEGFWVKVSEPGDIRTAALAGLIRSGLFEPSMPPIYTGAGWVERYAQLWKFRRCTDETHPGHWKSAVLCPACLERARAGRFEVEEVQEEFDAAGIVIDPSVNYAALLLDEDAPMGSMGPIETFGFEVEEVQEEFDAAGIVIDPSVNYAALLLDEDAPMGSMGPIETFGSGLIVTPPVLPDEPVMPPAGYVPPQPEPCLIGKDSPTELDARAETQAATEPEEKIEWCGTSVPGSDPEPVSAPSCPEPSSSFSHTDTSSYSTSSSDSCSSSSSDSYSSSDSGSGSSDSGGSCSSGD